MNTFRATGGVAECAWGYRDAEHAVLLFSLITRDRQKREHRLKCRVEDPARAREWEPELTRGRWVEIEAEAVSVEITKHGITRYETTAFRVLALKFPAPLALARRLLRPAVSEALEREGTGRDEG